MKYVIVIASRGNKQSFPEGHIHWLSVAGGMIFAVPGLQKYFHCNISSCPTLKVYILPKLLLPITCKLAWCLPLTIWPVMPDMKLVKGRSAKSRDHQSMSWSVTGCRMGVVLLSQLFILRAEISQLPAVVTLHINEFFITDSSPRVYSPL